MNQQVEIVFASNNTHKLEEMRGILGNSFRIRSLREIGCRDDIPETADTLKGNALQKARWVKERYGYDCFADDTGLSVEALGGEPGVRTARYAGEQCSSEDNIDKLLSELEGKTDRRARFSTVIALVTDSAEITFEGGIDGVIATERHGAGGFGYDPVFVPLETGVAFAEMDADAKNAISHRARAAAKLRDRLLADLDSAVNK